MANILQFNISGAATAPVLNAYAMALTSGGFSATNFDVTINLPSGQLMQIDEDGADAAAWTSAGVAFSVSGVDSFAITPAGITTGFPINGNTALYSDATKTTPIAGSAIVLGEGLYTTESVGDLSTGGAPRPYLYIPTIMAAIYTLADDLMNDQCECALNSEKAEKYIKARAYLDIILNEADALTAVSEMAAIQTKIDELEAFLGGTGTLCGSC
jgi:hypothetical protein